MWYVLYVVHCYSVVCICMQLRGVYTCRVCVVFNNRRSNILVLIWFHYVIHIFLLVICIYMHVSCKRRLLLSKEQIFLIYFTYKVFSSPCIKKAWFFFHLFITCLIKLNPNLNFILRQLNVRIQLIFELHFINCTGQLNRYYLKLKYI